MTRIQQLYPRLVVDGADSAIAFYSSAFGAELVERYTAPDGRVVHALLRAGAATWAVKDADGYDPAPGDGGLPVILALYVDDPDAVAASMVDGGGRVIFEVSRPPVRRARRPAGRPVRARLDDRGPLRGPHARSRSRSGRRPCTRPSRRSHCPSTAGRRGSGPPVGFE